MKKIIELLNDELKAAFSACGYDEKYAKVVVSNRPDLCQYQCNGCMAATGIADQRPYSTNLTGKIVRNKINNANERKNVTVIADPCHILSWN